jgi:hypothetical protein
MKVPISGAGEHQLHRVDGEADVRRVLLVGAERRGEDQVDRRLRQRHDVLVVPAPVGVGAGDRDLALDDVAVEEVLQFLGEVRADPQRDVVEVDHQRGVGRVEGRIPVHQRVDHHVAHEAHPLGGNALAGQVGVPRALAGEQQVADGVGHQPVDLLGHRPVEGAQPRLDVRHRDRQLHRREGAGHRAVDVAHHHHAAGPRRAAQQVLLEGRQHLRGLRAVRARPRVEVHVRRGHPQLAEEHVAHRGVVVLAGVHQHPSEGRPPPRSSRAASARPS